MAVDVSASQQQILNPCVAIHTEATQVDRFRDRLQQLQCEGAPIQVLAIATPIIYARLNTGRTVQQYLPVDGLVSTTALLRRRLVEEMGTGRIAAHRIYQLNWSCSDASWIPRSQHMTEAKASTFRVVAFPKHLQLKLVAILQAYGYRIHPKRYTKELHVTMQTNVSSYFHFGIIDKCEINPEQCIGKGDQQQESQRFQIENLGYPAIAADAPCRAYFKMLEVLRNHIMLTPGDHVLDVGASPGGWTDCLVAHGARVVAVDPGELTIPVTNRPIVHLQHLLQDAIHQLEKMERFSLCVCDINIRVVHMAELMRTIAYLLIPGSHVVFTLKLGKKPTQAAIQGSFDQAVSILSRDFHQFQLIWLHANTQNERTLLATKT